MPLLSRVRSSTPAWLLALALMPAHAAEPPPPPQPAPWYASTALDDTPEAPGWLLLVGGLVAVGCACLERLNHRR